MFWPFRRKVQAEPHRETNNTTYLVLRISDEGLVTASVVPRTFHDAIEEDVIGGELVSLMTSLSSERLYPTIVAAVRDSNFRPNIKRKIIRSIGNIAKSKDVIDPCDVFPNIHES